jgi:hypothetical protein
MFGFFITRVGSSHYVIRSSNVMAYERLVVIVEND